MPLDLSAVRAHFPALQSGWAFMDNAGGAQILRPVLDRIEEYLTTSNVQLGASYEISQLARERVSVGAGAMATMINAADPSEVVMGPSSTQLLAMLARSVGSTLASGDEIIITDADHEANLGPWERLQERGIVIKCWGLNRESLQLELGDLDALMTDRTRLVTLTHTSNILGSIVPIAEISAFVHERGAAICVDGVAYAPHRLIDVQALDVDYYVFSFYKLFGPHYALLYGKRELLLELPGQNHHFVPESAIPYKFQAGNVNYELSYGMLGLGDYIATLAQQLGDESGDPRRQASLLFDWIALHEEGLAAQLLQYLTGKNRVRVIGHTRPDQQLRVPIVSFVVDGMKPEDVVAEVDQHRIGIRYGDFHSPRIIDKLGLRANHGVVRISLAHYNTAEEVGRLTGVLDALI